MLEGKAEAILRELEVCRGDVDEMLEKIKSARQRAEALGATVGRTQARDSMGRADDLFRDFDHDAVTVLDQGLGGAKDFQLASICKGERRAIVTLDKSTPSARSSGRT